MNRDRAAFMIACCALGLILGHIVASLFTEATQNERIEKLEGAKP